MLFRHKTGFSCFYGKLHKRKSHDVWHHCHVYRYLHNVTQSLPFGKILRNMEAESKQSCVLVYRYTKGITIVLSFRREPLFSCSILLGFLYRFFCTAPADHRAGGRARHRPTAGTHSDATGCGCIRRFPSVQKWLFYTEFKYSMITFFYYQQYGNLPSICAAHTTAHTLSLASVT